MTTVVDIQTESVKEVNNLIKAKVPLIYVVTADELATIKEIYNYNCKDNQGNIIRQLMIWSSYSGLVEYTESFFAKPIQAIGDYEGTNNPVTALKAVQNFVLPKDSTLKGAIFLFRDFHTALTPSTARQIKDMYESLIKNQPKKTIIGMGAILGHFHGAIKVGVEPSLEKQMSVVRWKLPTREQLEQMVRFQTKTIKAVTYTDEDYWAISRALQGLTFVEAETAIAMSHVEKGRLDVKRLMQEKKQIIMRGDILEYIDSDQSMDDLGGLDQFKAYVKAHTNSHSEDAIAFGVEPLKGVVLVGHPGCGKSASAKAIGNTWGIPTLRLDVGKVMSGLVGSSEQRMREVVAQAEAVAPCVVWVDEIEKALSGTKSSNFSDGGTLSRVFGTLLTAMEEGLHGVTIIATANDISMLPPELIRRFSETFYVGLPTDEERIDIWSIHLRKKKRDPEKFDLKKLSDTSNKFTGAEIQKALKEAIANCYHDNRREMTTEDICEAINSTKPIATVMSDKIKETQEWAKTRARFASSLSEAILKPGNQSVKVGGKALSIADLDKEMTELKPTSLGIKKPKKIIDTQPTSRLEDMDDDNKDKN